MFTFYLRDNYTLRELIPQMSSSCIDWMANWSHESHVVWWGTGKRKVIWTIEPLDPHLSGLPQPSIMFSLCTASNQTIIHDYLNPFYIPLKTSLSALSGVLLTKMFKNSFTTKGRNWRVRMAEAHLLTVSTWIFPTQTLVLNSELVHHNHQQIPLGRL